MIMFKSRQEDASARPILERTFPIPLRQRINLFAAIAQAAGMFWHASRSPKKANSSLKLKCIL